MTDRYARIREALPILIAEAQAKGGRNERAELIVDLLEERDALRKALKDLIAWVPSADTYCRLGFDPEAPMRVLEEARSALAQSEYHGHSTKS